MVLSQGPIHLRVRRRSPGEFMFARSVFQTPDMQRQHELLNEVLFPRRVPLVTVRWWDDPMLFSWRC
jgi:hypothetical protein